MSRRKTVNKFLVDCLASANEDDDSVSPVRYADRPEVVSTGVVLPQLADCAHLVWKVNNNEADACIYLGPIQAASKSHAQELERANVRGIVNCTTSTSAFQTENDSMQVCQVPVHDVEGAAISLYLPGTSLFIHDQLQRGNSVLVHCAFGVSRSATVVLAYLIQYQNMSLEDAYRHVKSRRPTINPNTGFWSQLQAWETHCRAQQQQQQQQDQVLPMTSTSQMGKEWAETSLATFSTLHTIDGMDYKELCFAACRGNVTNDVLFVALDHVWGRAVCDFAVRWLVELLSYMHEETGGLAVANEVLSMLEDADSKFAQNWEGELYPEWIEKIRTALDQAGMVSKTSIA